MKSTRRRFLQQASGMAATGAVACFWSSRTARAESKNDRLNVGAIGVSQYCNRWGQAGPFDGRGSVIGHQAGQLGNMVACCDVNRAHADVFASRYDTRPAIYGDYRELLARDDIDVVTIGTPDHWHVPIAVAAMRAGKDVYCEKPLTLTLDQGGLICRTVRETGRVFQVGTQQRSEYDRMFLKAVAIARGGRLGGKLKAVASVGQPDFMRENTSAGPFATEPVPDGLDWDFWLGPVPAVPYCPPRGDYDFRWWLEYSGGQVTDWGVHHLDIALWALGGDRTGVAEVEGSGDLPLFSGDDVDPVAFFAGRQALPNSYNCARSFDCHMTLPGGNRIQLISGPNELIISGEDGRIRVNRGGLTGKPIEQMTPAEWRKVDEQIIELCKGKQPGSHMANFFACVKDRSEPISDVFSHVNSVDACHMANIGMILGRKLTWEAQRREFVDDPEANALRGRPAREPYAVV